MGGSAVNAPNQPPGGNGRGRQPPGRPSAQPQPPQRPAAHGAPAAAGRPEPGGARPQPPQQDAAVPACRPPAAASRGPTPSNALPASGAASAAAACSRTSAPPRPNGQARSPAGTAARAQAGPKLAPSVRPHAAPQAGTPADGSGKATGRRQGPRPAPQQPAAQRPPRITVNGAAPRAAQPAVPPARVQTQQRQPQRPPQPAHAAAAARHRPRLPRRRRSLSAAGGDAARWRPRRRSPADFGAQPARRGATGERAHAVAVATLAAFAQSVRHRRQPVSHAVLPDRDLQRRGLCHRQAALRTAGPADRGPDRQRAARRHPRHRRSVDARRRDRPALSVHRRRVDVQGAATISNTANTASPKARACATWSTPSSKARWCSIAFTVAEGLTSDQIVQRLTENEVLTGNIRDIPREGTLLPETYRFTRGMTREQMIRRMQQDAAARVAGGLGAPQPRPADPDAGAARRRWPRSSRRKPASPRSARAWRRCSSTGCGRG